MSEFVNELIEAAQADIEIYRLNDTSGDYSSYAQYEVYMDDIEWLLSIPSSKPLTARNLRGAKRKFKEFLHRNLAMGIHGDGMVEKYINLQECLVNKVFKNTNNPEHYTARYNEEVCNRIRGIISSRMSGENNISAGHGGRNSPYSVNFVGYEGMTAAEKESTIAELTKKRAKTVKDNPQNNPKRKEYYMTRLGVSEGEAARMVSESQSTFSLAKCIEKHGEVKGVERFEERQNKWQTSLGNRTLEERYQDSRGKAGSVHGRLMNEGDPLDINFLYIMKLEDNLVKVGHSRDVGARIPEIELHSGRRVVGTLFCEVTLGTAFEYESLIVGAVKHYSSFYLGFLVGGTESTEYFRESDGFWDDLESKTEELGLRFLEYK